MARLWEFLVCPVHRANAVDFLFVVFQLYAIVVMGIRLVNFDISDMDKCDVLYNDGEWLDAPGLPPSHWQPRGCMLYDYRKIDINSCLRNQRVIFIGDSTTRQVFLAVTRKLGHDRAAELGTGQIHGDITIKSDQVLLEFSWDPWLNSTRFQNELRNFDAQMGEVTYQHSRMPNSTTLLVFGAPGLWYARYGSKDWFEDYKNAIDNIFSYGRVSISPELPTTPPANFSSISPPVLLPVLVPWYPSLSTSRAESITPEAIDNMQTHLANASVWASTQMASNRMISIPWSFSLMVKDTPEAYDSSGLHIVDSVANRQADVLLNKWCNSRAVNAGYPYNRSCCSTYPMPVPSQWILLFLAVVGFPVLVSCHRTWLGRKWYSQTGMTLQAGNIFFSIVYWCFYSDRLGYFDKLHKQFHHNQFLWLCLIFVMVGIASVKKNTERATPPKSDIEDIKDSEFLSRRQTEEWKGWMQCFILLYHYTGASKILWAYKVVRILVASYLFLTGYGHALYFLRKGDFSIKRLASILVRLNLLSFVLSYMMRTEYFFYYFAPLVSFWFMVVYFTLGIGHQGNHNITFLFLKLVMSSTLTTALVRIPGLLESLFSVLKTLFGISWLAKEWRFRVSLDLYIVYVGILCAIGHIQYQNYTKKSFTTSTNSLNSIVVFRRTALTVISFLFLLKFLVLIEPIANKYSYNALHPYISFIPILCFVFLRNSHARLRGHHSTAFAWLGRCSLETYILQYHIWLAGDSYGLLSLGTFGRGLDAAILTPAFLLMSWLTARATETLTAAIVDSFSLPIKLTKNGRARAARDIDTEKTEQTYDESSSRAH